MYECVRVCECVYVRVVCTLVCMCLVYSTMTVYMLVCVYKTHANKCTHNPHKHTHTHTLCIIHLCINIIYAQIYYNIQLQYNRKSQMFTSIALYIYTHYTCLHVSRIFYYDSVHVSVCIQDTCKQVYMHKCYLCTNVL